jgi:hypothetical protein
MALLSLFVLVMLVLLLSLELRNKSLDERKFFKALLLVTIEPCDKSYKNDEDFFAGCNFKAEYFLWEKC